MKTSLLAAAAVVLAGCTVTATRNDPVSDLPSARIVPGVELLLTDSVGLLRDRRIGLISNHAAVDRQGRATVDLLARDRRVSAVNGRLVRIFAPEHGIRVDQDWEHVRDTVDAATGIPIVSLYRTRTSAPPDSLLRDLDILVFDLPDVGTRTWTYVGLMIYSMRAAARTGKPILVVDRPNPVTGFFVEGPMLDSALANPEDDSPERRGQAYALWPMPLRHGMTIGEMARFYNDVLSLGANLRVIPMRNWSRDLWYDRTGMPWVRPSPNMPSVQSALLYPGLVPYEASNLSVGRGTPIAFQWFGAPWLRVKEVIDLFEERPLRGVRFVADTIRIGNATDRKYPNQTVPGIRMVITERNRVQPSRIAATLLWALQRTSPDSLRLDTLAFDLRFGSPSLRRALIAGEDPDALLDREYQAVFTFREFSRRYFLYR